MVTLSLPPTRNSGSTSPTSTRTQTRVSKAAERTVKSDLHFTHPAPVWACSFLELVCSAATWATKAGNPWQCMMDTHMDDMRCTMYRSVAVLVEAAAKVAEVQDPVCIVLMLHPRHTRQMGGTLPSATGSIDLRREPFHIWMWSNREREDDKKGRYTWYK